MNKKNSSALFATDLSISYVNNTLEIETRPIRRKTNSIISTFQNIMSTLENIMILMMYFIPNLDKKTSQIILTIYIHIYWISSLSTTIANIPFGYELSLVFTILALIKYNNA